MGILYYPAPLKGTRRASIEKKVLKRTRVPGHSFSIVGDSPGSQPADNSCKGADSPHRNSGYTCVLSSSNDFGTEKFMFRSTASRVAIALVLAGCSGLAPKDPTPVNPTAVTETHVVNEGVKGFPAFESTTRTYTRANMQRSESTVTGVGTFARFLGGASADARIERLDRKLVWTLEAKNKQYTECPLKGCPASIPRKPPGKKSAEDDKTRDAGCRLKIGNTTFTVEPTGQKRSINGFDTEQYDVKWLVTFKDNASRNATSALSIDLWMTPVTPALRDAMALEKTYARARDKILGIDTDTDRSLLLPIEVSRMLDSHLSQYVSRTDRSNFLASARKLDKVKGQPILTNVTWRLTGEACAMDASMKEIGDMPLFTFMWEVKSYNLEALHDSQFAPPKDYRRAK